MLIKEMPRYLLGSSTDPFLCNGTIMDLVHDVGYKPLSKIALKSLKRYGSRILLPYFSISLTIWSRPADLLFVSPSIACSISEISIFALRSNVSFIGVSQWDTGWGFSPKAIELAFVSHSKSSQICLWHSFFVILLCCLLVRFSFLMVRQKCLESPRLFCSSAMKNFLFCSSAIVCTLFGKLRTLFYQLPSPFVYVHAVAYLVSDLRSTILYHIMEPWGKTTRLWQMNSSWSPLLHSYMQLRHQFQIQCPILVATRVGEN